MLPRASSLAAVAAALLPIFGCAPRSEAEPPGAPGAPSAVVATAGVRSARVTWAAPATDGGAAITRYDVTGSPGDVTVSTSAREVEFTGLANGTTYTFRVTATNAAGTGPASTPSEPVTTPSLPGAPGALVATAGDHAVTLEWSAPASDGGAPVERYVVTVTPDGGAPRVLETVSTSIDVTELVNRVTYAFSVAAVNAAGAGPAVESAPVILRAPASAVLSSVLVDPAGPVVADGVSAALVTVVVRDADGFALAGQGVTIAAAGSGNTLVQASATTDPEGIVTATLTSTVAEEKALTVTVNGLIDLPAAPTVTFVPGPAARLRILQGAPATLVAGVTLAPALRVALEDAHGNAVSGAVVTLSIASGPNGGALLGTLSAAAIAGVATLDAVRIELAGTYALQCAVDGLVPMGCGTVVVRAAPPTRLAFDVAPGPIRATESFAPAVKVGFRDDYGNLSSPGPLSVTLRLGPTPDVGALVGSTTAAQVNGVATFASTSVDEPGTYALVASAPGFADVSSAPFAVTVAWELVSPEGGDVKSVAVAPDGGIVYALTSTNPVAGRAWRSLDRGVTWERASAGLRQTVFHVAADPTSATRAYVASLSDGLWVTENGGRRWGKLAAFRCDRVAVGPDGTVLVKDGANLRRSTDHGLTWSPDVTLPSSISDFAFDPSRATTVYVGTWSSGVYRSADGGASWSAAGALSSAGYVWQLAVDPASPETVWAATDRGLYESVDGGSTWALNGSASSQLTAVVFDPSVPNRMYAVRGGNVEQSDDGGGLWSSAGLSSSASLFPVPGAGVEPGAILADGIYDYGGLFRRQEGGTWERSSAGLRGATPRIAVHPADSSVVLAAHQGIQRSTDGGLSWTATAGVPVGAEPSCMSFNPFAPSSALGAGSKLFRSSDTGVSWVQAGTIAGPLLFDRARSGAVLATSSNVVYRSQDGGTSWSPSNTGLPLSGTVQFFVQDPAHLQSIIVSLATVGLFRSFDGGAMWTAMNGPSGVTALSIDPRDDRVLVALDSNGVSRTTDGGATWQHVTTVAPLANGTLARDPGNPDVLLAGRMEYLHRSEDGGLTWKRASSGYLGGSTVFEIFFASPGVAYVSTSTGVYRTTTGGR